MQLSLADNCVHLWNERGAVAKLPTDLDNTIAVIVIMVTVLRFIALNTMRVNTG
jgi:hypothetical protein